MKYSIKVKTNLKLKKIPVKRIVQNGPRLETVFTKTEIKTE